MPFFGNGPMEDHYVGDGSDLADAASSIKNIGTRIELKNAVGDYVEVFDLIYPQKEKFKEISQQLVDKHNEINKIKELDKKLLDTRKERVGRRVTDKVAGQAGAADAPPADAAPAAAPAPAPIAYAPPPGPPPGAGAGAGPGAGAGAGAGAAADPAAAAAAIQAGQPLNARELFSNAGLQFEDVLGAGPVGKLRLVEGQRVRLVRNLGIFRDDAGETEARAALQVAQQAAQQGGDFNQLTDETGTTSGKGWKIVTLRLDKFPDVDVEIKVFDDQGQLNLISSPAAAAAPAGV